MVLLILFALGCAAVGAELANQHMSGWELLAFTIVGIISIQISYLITFIVKGV